MAENFKLLVLITKLQKPVDVCLRRWVDQRDGMIIFEELLVSIYYSLHEMKENKCEPRFSNENPVKADSLFQLITDFSFIVTLVITRNILDYLLTVTRKLQN